VGALIALYDRAVGFYASLVNINAYHQPGVEAGKKAAAGVLKTLSRVRGSLSATPQAAEQIAAALGEDAVAVYHALNHLAANDTHVRKHTGGTADADTFVLA
jgi:glucose-6-phosphate isomerase